MDKIQLASKILSFWNIVEFLDQKEFPKESFVNKKIVRDEKNFSQRKIHVKRQRMINLFHEINHDTNFEQIFEQDQKIFLRNQWLGKKQHVCIARVPRQMCVRKLDELLHISEYEGNRDQSDIALIGFKVNSQGQYEERTFSLSPLIWGIMMIYKYGSEARNKITQEEYAKNIEPYEQYLTNKGIVSAEVMNELVSKINQDYMFPLFRQNAKCEGLLIYHRYATKEDMEKNDGSRDDVSALARSYYSNDLILVKEKIESGVFGYHNTMQKNVIDYIVSQVEGIPEREDKVDIRMDREMLEQILAPKRMPIGKWPSRYKASFMQQVAINLALSSRNSTYPIFSVNGPPGTGKTTLLKEIIVSNIIERTKLLMKYQKPDDAFYECYFQGGDLKNHGYDDDDCCYYRFRNEQINDYGMLVASNNNAAVENITKDLPNGDDLCKGLRASDNAPELKEIEEMFDLSKVMNTELYTVKVDQKKSEKVQVEKPDIYFSWLAHRLLSKDETDTENFHEWGMISAPLGKMINIDWFSYHVLNPLIDEFLDEQQRMQRQSRYKIAVKEFKEQLAIVEKLQGQMDEACHLEEQYNCEMRKKSDEINCASNRITDIEKQINEIRKKISITEQAFEQSNGKVSELDDLFFKYVIDEEREKKQLDIYSQRLKDISNSIVEMEEKLKFRDNLFALFGKKTERLNQIDEVRKYREQEKLKKEIIQKQFNDISEKKKEIDRLISIEAEKSQIYYKELDLLKCKIEKYKIMQERLREDIGNCRTEIILGQQRLKKEMQSIKESRDVLDENFWNNYFSSENDKSTWAQLRSPWCTKELDRAREKLFYLALQVHKEFILSSKAVRSNLVNLAFMWNERSNSKGDSVRVKENDRKSAFSHLFNTLFLFVPVISTTFASVQTFLRDITRPSEIGMLIVDEAGQASPHIAVGALYRCRQAIIVGDPKQVEPVVLTSTRRIRNIFEDEILHPYIVSQMLSVQNFADKINPYGSYISNGKDKTKDEWVGCPLVVHRRCIDPMFSISNNMSYGNTMKKATDDPLDEENDRFILKESFWIAVSGNEKSTVSKNHFVREQGEKAFQIIKASFVKHDGIPDLYLISPFTSVISEMKKLVMDRMEDTKYKQDAERWCKDNCGTVHKFQGKEASEVIFLLGCDQNSSGSVRWVKSNIINVAVTRAKYRFCVIGDYDVWKENKYLQLVYEKLSKWE